MAYLRISFCALGTHTVCPLQIVVTMADLLRLVHSMEYTWHTTFSSADLTSHSLSIYHLSSLSLFLPFSFLSFNRPFFFLFPSYLLSSVLLVYLSFFFPSFMSFFFPSSFSRFFLISFLLCIFVIVSFAPFFLVSLLLSLCFLCRPTLFHSFLSLFRSLCNQAMDHVTSVTG
jgi:hypothetical protein